MKSEGDSEQENPLHHKKEELCMTRPAYRQGRNFTAVKVYTVASESQHLFVYGVPSINLRSELKSIFNKYGEILTIHVVPEQKVEVFTECYHIHYRRIQSARIAKKLVDNKSFYGGVLHVCYAPEYESLEETITKLQQRKKDVLIRLNKYDSVLHPIEAVGHPNVTENEKSGTVKRNLPTMDIPPIYHEEDPILSLKKKQKKNTEDNIAKYASQLSDDNGGLCNKINNSKSKYSKKFVPLPLRHISISEAPVHGPQLPESLQNTPKNLEVGTVSTQANLESLPRVLDVSQNPPKSNMRKVGSTEKRIIFRKKVHDKIVDK